MEAQNCDHDASERPARRKGEPWLTIAGIVLLIAFALAAYSESLHLPPAFEGDESAYYHETCWIAEHGGATQFFLRCLLGRYPYDNRHPLIQWAASPWGGRLLKAVRPMRAVKVLLSVVSLVAVWWVFRRRIPAEAALFLTALLVLTENWAIKARVFVVEPVVYALIFLAWALIAGWLRPRWRWFWAGAAAGLAYLSKGTAILLLLTLPPALFIHAWLLWRKGTRVWERKRLLWLGKAAGLFCLGFVLCAGMLLSRNVLRFGNPFHSHNSRIFWMDNWTDAQRVAEQPEQDRFTLRGYLRTHTAGDIARRIVYGVKHQTRRLFGFYAADRSFGRAVRWPACVASVAVVLAGLLGIWRARRSWQGIYTGLLIGIAYCLFVWYSYITVSSRFLAMVAPIVGLQAFSLDFKRLAVVGERFGKWLRSAAIALAVVSAVLLLARVDFRRLSLPRGEPPTTPEYRFLLRWFREEVVRKRAVCFQTPGLWPRYEMFWLLPGGLRVHSVPPFKSFEELQRHMTREGAQFLVVERDSLRPRLNIFREYFGYDAEGALVMRRPPPGWKIAKSDPYPPADFVILEKDCHKK